MAAEYADTEYDNLMHGGKPYESPQKPEMRQGLPAAAVPVLQPQVYHKNPTYEDIIHDGEKSQKPEMRQGLPAASVLGGSIPALPIPAGPVPAGPVQAGPVQAAPVSQTSEPQTDAEVLLKRYMAAMKRNKAAFIVLYVLGLLLLLTVVTHLYLFVGHTHNPQTINSRPQDIPGDKSMASAEVNNITTTAPVGMSTSTPAATMTMTTTTPTITSTATTTTLSQRIPKDCQGYRDSGVTMSGVYPIQILSFPEGAVVDVYCDMLTDGGGWTTLLRREDGSVPFQNLSWSYYKSGFGDVSREHWIGNDFMNELTLNNGDLYELRFDLEAFDGEKRFAEYQHFAVANETANYRLSLGTYSGGDAGDSFDYHANMEFTTIDRDNDKSSSSNCAASWTGGWWYNKCYRVKLTGTYGSTDHYKGVNWYKFTGYTESLKYADMKVRPSSIVKNSCKAWKDSGINNNDARNISLGWEGLEPSTILVLCDQGTKGGGWMLILKRIDGETVDFNRSWAEYRDGFGQQNGEFWFGLETLHKITSTVVIYELYIGLKTSSNDIRYIIYTSFKVTAESDDYRLVLGPVKEGDLVDSLRVNNGQPFSTRDVDNDNWEQNCAQTNAAGWWYDSCTEALLTGFNYSVVPVEQRLHWNNWLGTGEEFPPIAEATMMIRPVN